MQKKVEKTKKVLFCFVGIEFPGECYDESAKTAYTVGRHFPEDQCMEIDCAKDFSMSFVSWVLIFKSVLLSTFYWIVISIHIIIISCGSYGPPPKGYHYVKNLKLKYPDCCNQLVKKNRVPTKSSNKKRTWCSIQICGVINNEVKNLFCLLSIFLDRPRISIEIQIKFMMTEK